MLRKKKIAKNNREKSHVAARVISFLGLFLWILPVLVIGQPVEYPFRSGESATYGAYYNLDFIWIQSGEVSFTVDTARFQNQKTWHMLAIGKTFKAYDLLMSVRDTFETFSDYDTFRPIYSRRSMNHGKETSNHQYRFDYKAGKINTDIRQSKQETYHGSIQLQDNAYDLLATAYKFRKFDFDKLFIGEKIPYSMIIDRQIANLYFRYLGKENVKTRNGQKFRCHKVSIYLMQGDFFPEGEDMKVWFTDDKNHLPIQVETKILIGSVKALLLNASHLKYPLTSKIN